MNALSMDNTPAEEAALCPLLLTFQIAGLFPGAAVFFLERAPLLSFEKVVSTRRRGLYRPLFVTSRNALTFAIPYYLPKIV